MIAIEPPLGIDPNWGKVAKKQRGFHRKDREYKLNRNQIDFEEYIQSGRIQQRDPSFPPPDIVTPPRRPWESYLDSKLSSYRNLKQRDFEIATFENGVWDRDSAHAAFYAQKLASLIQFHISGNFSKRYPGRSLKTLWPEQVAYAALAVVIGAEDEGFGLARLCLDSYRQGWVESPDFFALYIFMFRLFADHLGQPPLELVGEPSRETFTNALFDQWRTPDPTVLAPLCLAVCDFHTHRCKPDKGDVFHEFTEGSWVLCPIEILLLFRLRELNGLSNPELDHPLMNSALGQLPTEGSWVVDPLLSRVEQRMIADGFDEDQIRSLATDGSISSNHGKINKSWLPRFVGRAIGRE
jgi:hypothetical protein